MTLNNDIEIFISCTVIPYFHSLLQEVAGS
jgi:hypothetical protein